MRWRVTASATGALLRQFGATVGTQPSAISNPSGDRLFTAQGADVAGLVPLGRRCRKATVSAANHT